MFAGRRRTPEQIEAAAQAASAKAVAGGPSAGKTKAVSVGTFRPLKYDGQVITYRKRSYPAAGATVEVSDFRSGLVGRKHTTDILVRLATGEVIPWHQTDAGISARVTHNAAVKFAAAVNSAS